MTDLTDLLHEAVEREGLVGAQLVVLESGVAHTAEAGVCDVTSDRAVGPATLFEIGSITKPFVAAALLVVQQDGLVDLDEPVGALVPEWRRAGGPAVTGRQLLSHTSGLACDFFPDTGKGEDCLAAYAELLAVQPPDLPPGTTASYSNGAYALAGRLLERATGAPFDDALDRTLLAPAGAVGLRTWNRLDGVADLARGHQQVAGQSAVVDRRFPRAMTPAGGLVSSALSLAHLARTLTIDSTAAPGLPAGLPERSRERLAPLPDRPATACGWGWGVSSSPHELLLAHDGGTLGQSAYLRILPDSDVVVALLVNRVSAGTAGKALIDSALEAVGRPPLDPPPAPASLPDAVVDPAAVIGLYRRAAGSVDVRPAGDGLHGVVEVDEHLEMARQRLDGPLELQPSGLWHLDTAEGAVPLLFLPASSQRAVCALVGGRGHGRVSGP